MVPPEAFSIRSTRDRGLHRLTPIGELDIATAPLLEAALDCSARRGGDDHDRR